MSGEEEAYRQARRNLGNLAAAGKRFLELRRWLRLDDSLQDTRHALRRLRKTSAFTIPVMLTPALGIGATTPIFILAHAVSQDTGCLSSATRGLNIEQTAMMNIEKKAARHE